MDFDKEWIEDVVRYIMRHDGPDRHTDGSDVITDFICAYIMGDGDRWLLDYKAQKVKTHRFSM